MEHTDLTFITNEEGQTLLKRFEVLLQGAKTFDALVGYFYSSGFHALYRALEQTDQIRILIGIGTDQQTYEQIRQFGQTELQLSHKEAKTHYSKLVEQDLAASEDSPQVEEGIRKFIEWLKSGKLKIKAYPSANIHAKLYIMAYREGEKDKGRVITGSSNFTQAGLTDNLEFNVELKNAGDFKFALDKFNDLWEPAVDVSEKFVETVQDRTWLSDTITPYHLYLKALYEYFRDELSQSQELFQVLLPERFKRLVYQEDAIFNAKRILEEYGGVFISDVVGLGKTYMSAMLANQLDGRTLVLAPPALLDKNNPGSWPNVMVDFGIKGFECESLGKLDHVIERGSERFKNVIVDEAHRFRTEGTIGYEKMAQICRGKRVILVSATPLNNWPQDILNQIKLFQKPRHSTIPNLPDLESFFSRLQQRLKRLDRQEDREEYMKVVEDNAKQIREQVLKYLMIRRTRNEIQKYYGDDLAKQNMSFPKVADPEPLFYELNEVEDAVFSKTIELITQKFSYARYTPLLYYEQEQLDQLELQSQRNMGCFMKILLVKRLESSFFAFRQTVQRFVRSYERFLEEFHNGNVYVSKGYTDKIFELLENDDDAAIQRLIDEDKAKVYPASGFKRSFEVDLQKDLATLKEIQRQWQQITRDPKWLKLKQELAQRKLLKNSKLLIFTESKETANYLSELVAKEHPGQVLLFTGGSSTATRATVIDNFDANARHPKDEHRILIATEVLSEGVNLHRVNVVINYDIPWNPTRLMQRVGRVNRIDTEFDEVFTFNFFPTQQSNDQIKLREAAEVKIHAFINMLGNDARLLTEGEPITSFELFSRLNSKKTITGEDEGQESELKYFKLIKDIRDKDSELFAKIKELPKKARSAKSRDAEAEQLLTYFRKTKLQKFYLSDQNKTDELDFISAAQLLEADPKTKRRQVGQGFYALLDKNKKAFVEATTEEIGVSKARRGTDRASQALKILKSIKDLRTMTEDQEAFWHRVMVELQEGTLPRKLTQRLFLDLQEACRDGVSPLRIVAVLQRNIAPEFLQEHAVESSANTAGPREVILSQYLTQE